MKKKILNVGCGKETYGTDFIDFYPTRKEVIKCNVNEGKFPFKNNTFDEVYSKNLFEHLKNPLNFLKESYRVLKEGGKIIIITDNAGFWGIFGKTHHGGYEKYGKYGMDDRHYALFTANHLENWLKSVGFKNVKVSYMIGQANVKNSLHFLFMKSISVVSKKMMPQLKAIATK